MVSAAVPFFFLVSGYWLGLRTDEPHWYRRAVLKRLRTLGIPFLIWSVAMVVLVKTVVFAVKGTVGFIDILSALGFNLFAQPLNHPLWYVRMLILLVLISPVLVWLLKSRVRRIFLLTIFVCYWLFCPDTGLVKWPERWFWFVQFGFPLEGLVYFSLGLMLSELNGNAMRVPPAWVCILLCLAGWMLECVLPLYGLPGVSKLMIPSSLLWMWLIMPDKGLGRLPELSFPLYVLHVPILFVCNLTLKTVGVRCVNEIADVFLRWMLVVCLSSGFVVLFRHVSPRFAAWTFGGR